MYSVVHIVYLEQNTTPQDTVADLDNNGHHHERSKTIVVSLASGPQPQGNTQVGPLNHPSSPPPYDQNIPNTAPLPLGKLCLQHGLILIY